VRRKGVVFHADLKSDIGTEDAPIKKVRAPDFGNMSGICKKIFPNFHAVKIVSPRHGTFMATYSASSGIREGDLVAINVYNGIPIVTRTLRFGFTPENILLLNLEPSGDEKPLTTLKTNDIEWDESLGEKIGLEPISIKSLIGEKVFNVGLNGIKIGYNLLTLFSSARAKVTIAPELISCLAPNLKFISMAGAIIFKYKDNKGYMSRSTLKKTENGLIGVMHYVDGDVMFGLESLNINNIRIPGLKKNISDFISIRLVLDYKLEDYKIKTNVVTHSYQNRKLSIEGNGTLGRNIHSDIKKLLFLNGSLEKYSSGIATVNNKDRPVTYFEGISLKGDAFTFSAGEQTVVKTDETNITLGDTNTISLGEHNTRSQGDRLSLQFPVSLTSAHTSMLYAIKTEIKYGNEITINYGKENRVKINSKTEYDIDTDSAISTKEELISPIRSIYSVNEEQIFEQNSNLEKECGKTVFLNGRCEDTLSLIPDGTGLSYISTKEKKEAKLKIGIGGFDLKTSGNIQIKGWESIFNTGLTVFNGKSQFNQGIVALKEFSISASNVSINSENNINFRGKNISLVADSLGVQYKNSLSISSPYSPVVNKLPTQPVQIIFEANSVNMQSENMTLQSVQSISVTATKTATFGAQQTTITGLEL